MSESDSFIREVTEEVERDRMNRQLKKWGPWAGLAALLVVGATWFWQIQQNQDRAAREEIGRILLSEELANPETAAEARSLLTGPPGVLADLRLAATQNAAGDTAAAIETYRSVAGRADIEPAYTDLAALRAARLLAVSGDPGEVYALLEPIEAPGRPYRLLARELRAVLMLNLGDTEGAHAVLRAILADPTRPQGLSLRVRDLLLATDGAVAR